ncbi:MAG: hypothetical protein B7Z04_12630 [Rhodobacterales bacterium 32-66-9]|nr:MAG: hypothetical protein B7Z04_12630 [Rhodobacterales bacterium 32-66-9]
MRPTVNDIAREAGVSLATVDRVLNARPGVRDKTIRAVNEAISRLGYVRDLTAANLARGRNYRVAVVLPDTESQFIQSLAKSLAEAGSMAATSRTELRIAECRVRPFRRHRQLRGGPDGGRDDGSLPGRRAGSGHGARPVAAGPGHDRTTPRLRRGHAARFPRPRRAAVAGDPWLACHPAPGRGRDAVERARCQGDLCHGRRQPCLDATH